MSKNARMDTCKNLRNFFPDHKMKNEKIKQKASTICYVFRCLLMTKIIIVCWNIFAGIIELDDDARLIGNSVHR